LLIAAGVGKKKLDSHAVFEVTLDLGGNPQRIGSPLVFRIFHEDDPEFAFEMTGSGPFEFLIYGSWLYSACATPRDEVLGIRACIELFDVIAASFEGGSASLTSEAAVAATVTPASPG
jgi:hypothetical protein